VAVFTELSLGDADRVVRAHGLPGCTGVVPIAAGSVNSNFFVDGPAGRRFLRIYEEQDESGVAYEWALLDHLESGGVPVPRRVRGPRPGEVRVAGKPTAMFELVGGVESCQALVSPGRAHAVGATLARAHRAGEGFGWRRAGRFEQSDVRARLDRADAHGRPELAGPIARLRQISLEVEARWPTTLPTGIIHGDMFRDNVRWEGDEVVAIIDWESASDGVLAYDLVVVLWSWCYGATLDWELARQVTRGYDAVRPLTDAEWEALRLLMMAAAARFATTRITDFHLREGVGERVHKDYRRFLDRLELAAALTPDELATRLGRRA